MAPPKEHQQDSHLAERESDPRGDPRGRSAPYPHAGQIRRCGLETLVRLIGPPPVLIPGVTRLFCKKDSKPATGGLHHPLRCFTRVILQKVAIPPQQVLGCRAKA